LVCFNSVRHRQSKQQANSHNGGLHDSA
jgi:hypothetical protein